MVLGVVVKGSGTMQITWPAIVVISEPGGVAESVGVRSLVTAQAGRVVLEGEVG